MLFCYFNKNSVGHESHSATKTSGHGATEENQWLDDGAYLKVSIGCHRPKIGINGQTDIAWNGPIEEVARSQALEDEGLLSHLGIQAIEGFEVSEVDPDYPNFKRGGFGGGPICQMNFILESEKGHGIVSGITLAQISPFGFIYRLCFLWVYLIEIKNDVAGVIDSSLIRLITSRSSRYNRVERVYGNHTVNMLNDCKQERVDDCSKEELTRIPIWVKLLDVPIQVFEEDGISLIATFIGKPVMLDSYTSSMCNDSWGRSSFARCLIEVNSEADLVDIVTIGESSLCEDDFTKEIIRVEYE
ncbi:zinc knuckle CX2CX4HX4C containing protein [Tanacetum coccineum]